jgi:glycosyltransferase involved in cell wall biosynthesis
MTAYNREKYIAQAIESVLSSTFKDLELIIVDDCSKDKTVEIARRYLHDSRVRVYVNESNLGDYPNRNRAASLARGRYLKYVDADDYIYPHGLEVLINAMERFPEAGFGLASLPQDAKRPFPFQLSPLEAYRRHYFETGLFGRAPLSAIIRRSAFEAVGGFSGKRMVGDFEFWHILSARYSVVLMPSGVVWYRVHDEQEMHDYRRNPLVPFAYGLIALEQLGRADCPFSKEDAARAAGFVLRGQSRAILRTLSKFQTQSAMTMYTQLGLSIASLLSAAFGNGQRAE